MFGFHLEDILRSGDKLLHSLPPTCVEELKAARAEAKKLKAQEPEIGHGRSTSRIMKAWWPGAVILNYVYTSGCKPGINLFGGWKGKVKFWGGLT